MAQLPIRKAASPAVNAAISSLRCGYSMLLASSVWCLVTSWPWLVHVSATTPCKPVSTTSSTPITSLTSQQWQSWQDGGIPTAVHVASTTTPPYYHNFHLKLFRTKRTSSPPCQVAEGGSKFCSYRVSLETGSLKRQFPSLMETANKSYCSCKVLKHSGEDTTEYQVNGPHCLEQLFDSNDSLVVFVLNPVVLPLFKFKVRGQLYLNIEATQKQWIISKTNNKGLENDISVFHGYDPVVIRPRSKLCSEFELDLSRNRSTHIPRGNARVFGNGVMLGEERIQATIVSVSAWKYRIDVCWSNLTALLPNGTYQLLIYLTNEHYLTLYVGQTLWHTFTLIDLRPSPDTVVSVQPTSSEPAPKTGEVGVFGIGTSMKSLPATVTSSANSIDPAMPAGLQPQPEDTSKTLIYIVTSSVVFILMILAIVAVCYLRHTCRQSAKLSAMATKILQKDRQESITSVTSTHSNSTLLSSVSVAESPCTRMRGRDVSYAISQLSMQTSHSTGLTGSTQSPTPPPLRPVPPTPPSIANPYSTEPGQGQTGPLEVLYEPCHEYALLNDVTPRPPSAPLPSSASTVPPARSGQQTEPKVVMKTRGATTLPPAQHGQPTPPKFMTKTRSASTTPCSEPEGYMDMTLVSGHVGDKHSPGRQQMTIKTTIHRQQSHTSLQTASPGRRPLLRTTHSEGQLAVNSKLHSVPTTPEVAVPRSYCSATAAATATTATSSTFCTSPVISEKEEYLPMASVMGGSHDRSLPSSASNQGQVEVQYLNRPPQITITVSNDNSTFLAKSAGR